MYDTKKHTGAAKKVADMAKAIHRLLQIADLAAYYQPGELGENPQMMTYDIAFARQALAEAEGLPDEIERTYALAQHAPLIEPGPDWEDECR